MTAFATAQERKAAAFVDDDQAADDDAQASTPGEWPEPVALGGYGRLPEFPSEVLPEWVDEMVAAVAESTQTPRDLAGMVALGTLAVPVAGRVRVSVATPGGAEIWSEPLNLWTAVALPPANMKSAVLTMLSAPLADWERSEAERLRPMISEAQTRRAVAEKAYARAVDLAGKATGDAVKEAGLEALAAGQKLDEEVVPVVPRLIADDTTPEALTSLLAEQGGRLGVVSAEATTFAIMAGRYSRGEPNLEVFLQGHAGDSLRVDRKGRPSEFIASPALTLVLAIQPDVLRSVGERREFRGRGLLARFLYALPASLVGARNVTDPPPVPAAVRDRYNARLRALVEHYAQADATKLLRLDPDAYRLYVEYRKGLEPRLGAAGDLHHIADWAGKLHGAVIRLAGIITAARDTTAETIDAPTMRAAVTLADYLVPHALAAHDAMGADGPIGGARHLLAWIRRHVAETGAGRFTRRDAHQANRARYAKVADLDPALDVLTEYGWIAPEETHVGPKGGRPSPAYEIHPHTAKPRSEPSEPPPGGGIESSEGTLLAARRDPARFAR